MNDGRSVRFLLVEDDENHAKIITRSLAKSRILNEFDWVRDGEEAIKFLENSLYDTDFTRPDVVLLDLKLPKVSGHEVLKKIKTDSKLKSIPVVILTTSTAEVDRVKAYEYKANSYLVKPLDFEQFKTLVDDLSFYWGIWNVPPSNQHAFFIERRNTKPGKAKTAQAIKKF